MYRLMILLLLFMTSSADPRSPRIYNVLITSKKNLSPSHAQPVYEPVLRTTSIGYAFPSWAYSSFLQSVPNAYLNPTYSGYSRIGGTLIKQNEEISLNNGTLPVEAIQIDKSPNLESTELFNHEDPNESVGHFIRPLRPFPFNFGKYVPKDDSDEEEVSKNVPSYSEEETDPKKVIANLRRNPEIPDVPPPPLPVRNPSKQQE
ncbi:hypothetical protein ABEB36_011185 [Hypothenemus hampei]|uniref:Uncharacterized protein n=1 Tax=Hypothenemus hampei TaxID=57062 RepID=A0ABD1EEH2_HYPHA